MHVISIIKIISINLIWVIQNSYQQTCNETGLQRYDEIASMVYTVGNMKARFPENSDQLKSWCKKNNEAIVECEQYNKKCNKNSFKHLMNLYIYGLKRTLRLYCKIGSKPAKSLTDSAPCFNRNKKVEISCMTDLIVTTLGIQNHPDDKKKLPLFCCTVNIFFDCFEERMINLPGCNEKNLDNLKNYLTSQSTDMLDAFCGDYKPDSDKCSKLGNPTKKTNSQKVYESPLIPTAELFESIQDI